MNVYENANITTLLENNTYPGRGIIIGTTPDNSHAAFAYFIMGRSENSRNRVFCEKDGGLITKAYDESKLSDPSLIIYAPVRLINGCTIVTNGDQTDTIYDFIKSGKTFEQALLTRDYEPDMPNFTPRISGIICPTGDSFSYKLNILKSIDEKGSACARYTFDYPSIAGLGHYIHTYNCDGNPIPTFTGEPERISMGNDIDEFTNSIWNSLNADNKISLYVRYISLSDGCCENRLINKNK